MTVHVVSPTISQDRPLSCFKPICGTIHAANTLRLVCLLQRLHCQAKFFQITQKREKANCLHECCDVSLSLQEQQQKTKPATDVSVRGRFLRSLKKRREPQLAASVHVLDLYLYIHI